MTVPFISTSGPPLLPVFIVASVWIKLKNCWPCSVLIDLPRPLTIPSVAVGPPLMSKALPRVMTQSPTRMSLVSDSVANGSPIGINLENRDIGSDVLADDRCRVSLAVRQVRLELLGTPYDVLVRSDVPVGSNDESRARALIPERGEEPANKPFRGYGYDPGFDLFDHIGQ